MKTIPATIDPIELNKANKPHTMKFRRQSSHRLFTAKITPGIIPPMSAPEKNFPR